VLIDVFAPALAAFLCGFAALREIKSKEQDFDITAQDSGLIFDGRFSKLDLTNKGEPTENQP
jgi:hypothetical protein